MIFLSYPRTGVNFLCRAIEYKSKVYINYNHETYTDENIILNIVRDPKESMSSWISMSDTNEELMLKNNSVDALINVVAKTKYINMYKFLLSKNTIFINYKDFKDIDKLVVKICQTLNLDYEDIIIDIEEINKINEGQRDKGYIITSKTNPRYEEYKKIIDDIDLSECYDLYYQALDRCIKI